MGAIEAVWILLIQAVDSFSLKIPEAPPKDELEAITDPLEVLSKPWFWLIAGAVIVVTILALWSPVKKRVQARRARLSRLASERRSAAGANRKPEAAGSAAAIRGRSVGDSPDKVQETVVTEKTSEEITGMMFGIKSVVQQMPTEAALKAKLDEQKLLLESSGVVDGFIKDWVSDVQTEEVDSQKFSKMTLDAALLFDDVAAESEGPDESQPIHSGSTPDGGRYVRGKAQTPKPD